MKRAFYIMFMVAVCLMAAINVYAQPKPNTKLRPNETVLLYPKGQNSQAALPKTAGALEFNGLTGDEKVSEDGFTMNVGDKASLDIYLPKKPNGQMVIVCPGGGYVGVSMFNEGVYVAEWMLSKGITVAVLKYRMPNGHWAIPLTDVQNAFRYCRANAAKWKVSHIGVMGFSAGGHLAASASNLFTDEITRPDFSILIYPVITMKRSLTHWGSRVALIGPDQMWNDKNKMVREYERDRRMHHDLIEIFSLENQVSSQTPPTFIVLCQDDDIVPPENGIDYYSQLTLCGVQSELHVFPTGGHGWGFSAEKYVGKGNDRFSYARGEFEKSLDRWLTSLR